MQQANANQFIKQLLTSGLCGGLLWNDPYKEHGFQS